jgi:HEAT repeat protein
MGNEKKLAKITAWGEKQKFAKLVKLATDKDPEIRAAVATALAPIKQDEAFNAIVDLVRNDDIKVREAAIKALAINGRKAGGEHIRNIMTQERNASLIPLCQEAIAAIVAGDGR